MAFPVFISFIIFLRIGELLLARHNERWLLQNGAIEYGKQHYPLIVALHVLFLVSLILEYYSQQTHTYSIFLLVVYFALLAFKTWVIVSLGKFWNTKIYRIHNMSLVKKGPYKYFKHPNYLVVIAEIAVIPLAFHLNYTATIFTLLNIVMLFVRVKEENKALQN